MSAEGWPVSVAGNNAAAADMSATDCQQLWLGLMQSNAPTVSTTAGTDDYTASLLAAGVCRYTYNLDDGPDTIDYNANTGAVVSTIN